LLAEGKNSPTLGFVTTWRKLRMSNRVLPRPDSAHQTGDGISTQLNLKTNIMTQIEREVHKLLYEYNVIRI
jgi:hypothetical protein